MLTALRELAKVLVTLAVASIFVFSLLHLLPGDPAAAVINTGHRIATPDEIAIVRADLGLDRPFVAQYGTWLGGAVRGDLGRSWVSELPVRSVLADRVVTTAKLGLLTFALGLGLTLVLGAGSAIRPGGPVDLATRILATVGTAVPSFVLGLLAIRFLAAGLGIGTIATDGTLGTALLPALVGAIGLLTYWVRPFRALLADALASDWAVTGRARGWSTFRLLAVHAVPNACVAFLPFIGLGLAGVVAGSILIENVFAWPGLGPMVVEAIRRRDLPLIQGFALVSTVVYVVTTRLVDAVARTAGPDHSGAARRAEHWREGTA